MGAGENCMKKMKIIWRGLEFIPQGKDSGNRERGKEERRKESNSVGNQKFYKGRRANTQFQFILMTV